MDIKSKQNKLGASPDECYAITTTPERPGDKTRDREPTFGRCLGNSHLCVLTSPISAGIHDLHAIARHGSSRAVT